ncbi:MAG: hypothetical protein CL678_17035 [Bdellovibrionaceae bacterium]|nr:hypothetical protein [Pseudobdellovibrionaceae bacterium]|tara:strand:+ start:3191 stop:3778 length:588 start_codon:yes stop_codon:yes gene_type:complete
MRKITFWIGLCFGLSANAGVFDIPRFVDPDQFAIGVEPVLTLAREEGAGLGVNAKYTQGYNDWLNFQGIIGTGGGPQQFRIGASAIFDFFPDIGKQPGIGLATQARYVKRPIAGQTEFVAVPYIHKNFYSGNTEFDPFVSFPVGLGLSDGEAQTLMTFVMGSLFRLSDRFAFVSELGIGVKNTDSYFSGGVTFSH